MKFNCISSKTALAVVTSFCVAKLLAPPAIAQESQLGGGKPIEEVFSTMLGHLINIGSYQVSLKVDNRVSPVPTINILANNPDSDGTPPVCDSQEIRLSLSGYCPTSNEILQILTDVYAHYPTLTEVITGFNLDSSQIAAKELANNFNVLLGVMLDETADQNRTIFGCPSSY